MTVFVCDGEQEAVKIGTRKITPLEAKVDVKNVWTRKYGVENRADDARNRSL